MNSFISEAEQPPIRAPRNMKSPNIGSLFEEEYDRSQTYVEGENPVERFKSYLAFEQSLNPKFKASDIRQILAFIKEEEAFKNRYADLMASAPSFDDDDEDDDETYYMED
jgi:hypothetical protein